MEYVEFPYAAQYNMTCRVGYEISQSITDNKSTITVKSLEFKADAALPSVWWITGTVTVGGAVVWARDYWEANVQFPAGGQWYASVDFAQGVTAQTISHNSSGAASTAFAVNVKLASSSYSAYPKMCSGTVTVSLPTIPRVSGISAAGVELGTQMTITLDRKSSGFTDAVKWSCGTASGTIAEKGSGTRHYFTPSIELAQQNTTGTTVPVTITVETYSGSTKIGTGSMTVTCTIPASVKPAVGTITLTDNKGYSGTYGGYVQSKSELRVQAASSGSYGSTITKTVIQVGSLSAAGADKTFSLPNSGTVTVKVTVTDSRGRTGTKSTTVTVLKYAAPSTTLVSITRCDADGTQNPTGAYGKAVFTNTITSLGSHNTATHTVRYRKRGTSSWSSKTITAYTGSYSVVKGEGIITADVDSDYEICTRATDAFGSTTTAVSILPVAFALLDFDRANKAAGILQRASTAGVVSIGGDTKHFGHRITDVGAPTADTDAVTKKYVDDALAALVDGDGVSY